MYCELPPIFRGSNDYLLSLEELLSLEVTITNDQKVYYTDRIARSRMLHVLNISKSEQIACPDLSKRSVVVGKQTNNARSNMSSSVIHLIIVSTTTSK